MKKLEITWLSLKAIILISILSFLGFTACDVAQPEYGTTTVREKDVKLQQEKNDMIVKEDAETFDSTQQNE